MNCSMNKTLLFLDTQSSLNKHNNEVIFDLSITVVEQNRNISSEKFEKILRSRRIFNTKTILKPIYEHNFIIYENRNLIPGNKRTEYGYSDYKYTTFKNTMLNLKLVCDIFKPDAILGYNLEKSFYNIKNTQSFLKTSKFIYMNNPKLPSYSLFKLTECKAFDLSYKTDISIYIQNHCPNFIKEYEQFITEYDLSHDKFLFNLYRYSINNSTIPLISMGCYHNMFSVETLCKVIQKDGIRYFPQQCITNNYLKRKRSTFKLY